MAQTDDTKASGAATDFLLEEYRSHEAAVFESERTGETRVNFFLTVSSAIFAVMLFDGRGLMDADGWKAPRLGVCAVLLALLIFGRLTLARVVHRNLCTDREIESARRLRAYFVSVAPWIDTYLSRPIDPRKTREKLSLGKLVTRGGLVETVMLWNALIVAILFGMFGVTAAWRVHARTATTEWLPGALATVIGVIGLFGAWWAQQTWVNERYELGESARERVRRAGAASPVHQ